MSKTARALEQIEVDTLLEYLSRHKGTHKSQQKSHRNLLLTRLMLDAGLRVGEATQLLFSDVYFNSLPVTSIRVRWEIAKTKRERIVPVNSKLTEALKTFGAYFVTDILLSQTLPLFLNERCRLTITVRQVERIIAAASVSSLGGTVTPHMLRHTFATRLMRVTDLRTVQELLGHVSITSTQIYTHPSKDDLREAVNAI